MGEDKEICDIGKGCDIQDMADGSMELCIDDSKAAEYYMEMSFRRAYNRFGNLEEFTGFMQDLFNGKLDSFIDFYHTMNPRSQ